MWTEQKYTHSFMRSRSFWDTLTPHTHSPNHDHTHTHAPSHTHSYAHFHHKTPETKPSTRPRNKEFSMRLPPMRPSPSLFHCHHTDTVAYGFGSTREGWLMALNWPWILLSHLKFTGAGRISRRHWYFGAGFIGGFWSFLGR